MHRVFLLDNRDSFTHNLMQSFLRIGAQTCVERDAAGLLEKISTFHPTHLVLSPGPLSPREHPANALLLDHFATRLPLLGVCLGMQAINVWAGGSIRVDTPPRHGKTSAISHDARGLFSGVPLPMTVARYHSLVVDRLAENFVITARTDDDRVMAITHRTRPLVGVQFHPESFLTDAGETILENFLLLRPPSLEGRGLGEGDC